MTSGEWALIVSGLAVVVSVIGWFVSYRLSVAAQARLFLEQVENTARLDITRALRNHQDWLGSVKTKLVTLDVARNLESDGCQQDWLRISFELHRELVGNPEPSAGWCLALEEHEVLFPETRECRMELLDREIQFMTHLPELASSLAVSDRRHAAIDRATEVWPAIDDQAALMHDLIVYLQNRVLGKVTKNAVPEREPNVNLPRIVIEADGQLRVASAEPGAASRIITDPS